jgi:hypothetical protein
VYAALFAAKWLREGSYGMPSPDLPPTKPLTLAEYKKRIALRKVTDDSYEVYYTTSTAAPTRVRPGVAGGGKVPARNGSKPGADRTRARVEKIRIGLAGSLSSLPNLSRPLLYAPNP